MATTLLGIWFLIYGLVGLGVRIPQSDMLLAVLAVIVGVVFLLTGIRR